MILFITSTEGLLVFVGIVPVGLKIFLVETLEDGSVFVILL
jgi:hypothetical protein